MEDSEKSENSVLKNIQDRRRRRRKQERNVDWYSWLLADHPVLVLFLCACLIAGAVFVSVKFVKPPDFSNPSKGFEVRGTALSDRVVTWKNLYDNTGYNQTLSTYPILEANRQAEAQRHFDKVKRRNDKRKNKKKKQGKKSRSRQRRSIRPYQWNFTENGYFCYNPKPNYARFVIESNDKVSLWTVEGLRSICKADEALLSHITYADVCIHAPNTGQHPTKVVPSCCPTLSISNYVAYLADVPKCDSISASDIRRVSSLLRDCAPFYANKSLVDHCWRKGRAGRVDKKNPCDGVPSRCIKYDAVFSILYYLTDKAFLSSVLDKNRNFDFQLRYTTLFLPAFRNTDLLRIYNDNFCNATLVSNVSVAGIDFGLYDAVFNQTLQSDLKYPIAAMLAVMIIIIIFTKSIFITFMSITASVSSLFMAFFLYTVIFEISHFPYMNLTAIMVMVGIGADSIFVYYSAWKTYRDKDIHNGGSYGKKGLAVLDSSRFGVVTKLTLQHAVRSMFVTGITTASAFLANCASSVTAIKCFGIFTGLTVLMNLFLCVTWLPAAVVIHERYFSELYSIIFKFFTNIFKSCCNFNYCNFSCTTSGKCTNVFKCLKSCSRVFFHKIQIYIIVKLKWFWIFLGVLLGTGGCIAIFITPKLRLPSGDSDFQYFKSSHLFETYSSLNERFDFENESIGYMPVSIVFGIVPTDNGNPMDPDNKGKLVFSPQFNMSHPQSQRWLLEFCGKIRKQPFYKPHGDEYDELRICFIEPFKEWMTSNCITEDGIDNSPCCKKTTFPYPPTVFDRCLKKAVLQVSNTPGIRLNRWTPGPRFDKNDTLRAVIVEFQSQQPYTSSYDDISDFYKRLGSWIENETEHAPPGLRHKAWFRSEFQFHALQLGLYQGTITAIGLSMAVVCGTLIFTTCSLTVTILANITIACTIFMTVGLLVLAGWELNILESITISTTIGLSVDFTVHYAVAYLLAPSVNRDEKVEHSVSSMGTAITLAALTTFIAGLCMLRAQVSAFYQFGVFLMLIMTTSWFYGTYFFQSLCCIIGPQGKRRRSPGGVCCCGSCCADNDVDNDMSNANCLRSETSTVTKSNQTCTSQKHTTSSDSQSAAMMEMSSCASAPN